MTSRDANLRLTLGELEASPVSPPNWAGLARALYSINFDHLPSAGSGPSGPLNTALGRLDYSPEFWDFF